MGAPHRDRREKRREESTHTKGGLWNWVQELENGRPRSESPAGVSVSSGAPKIVSRGGHLEGAAKRGQARTMG